MRLMRLILTAVALAAPACGQAADPWSHATVALVVMVDNQFQPSHIVLRAGERYELRVENHGKALHEFTAPAFLKAAKVRDTRLLANGGTDIVVQAGSSVRIFLVAPAQGRYELTCADHDWDGMVGEIVVSP